MTIGCLHAQTKLDALVAQIEADAAKEETRLGLDTRMRVAERLRAVDPAKAKHVLDSGLPLLAQPIEPSHLVYRYMISYAMIDLDAAEAAGAKIANKNWVYIALIEQAGRVKDYARVKRLVAASERDGEYNIGSIATAIRDMRHDAPEEAAALLRERVEAFPVSSAKDLEVRILLRELMAADPQLSAKAAHKIFEAIARPDFKTNDTDWEETAIYKLRGKEIRTTTTFETVLFSSAAYLAVYDPEAFHAREASLPEWRASLEGVLKSDLPGIIQTPLTRRQKSTTRPAGPAPPRISYWTMTFEDGLATARKQDVEHYFGGLLALARRKDLSAEQRKQVFEEMWKVAPELPPWERYNGMRAAFHLAAESGIEGVFGPAALAWIATLDVASRSDNFFLVNDHAHNAFHMHFDELVDLFAQHDYALSQPNPSIAARQALRSLYRVASEHVDFTLKSLDGTTYHLADLRGKVVLIDFWATWCVPCRESIPALDKIYREWGGKGLVVLGIDDEPAATVRRFLASNPISYPILMDPDRKIHNSFGQDGNGQGIPMSVVFDRKGQVVDRVPYPHNEENFLKVLDLAGLRK